MARIVEKDFTVLPARCRVYPRLKRTVCLPLPLPAKAGPHLPTLEGWKAELAYTCIFFSLPSTAGDEDLTPGRKMSSRLFVVPCQSFAFSKVLFALSVHIFEYTKCGLLRPMIS